MATKSRKKKGQPQNSLKHWIIFLVIVLFLCGITYAIASQLGMRLPLDYYIETAYDKAQSVAREGVSKLKDATAEIREKVDTAPAPPSVEKVEKPKKDEAVKKEPQSGAVQVYFAPAKESATDGVDDHFVAFLKSADKSIDAAFYELDLQSAADALISEHKAGVKVRLVTDGDYKNEAPLQACVVAGIPVVWDDRGAFMHNKFCVVDGAEVWTGSTNITSNCMFKNNNNSLRIASEGLAENYSTEFLEMFEGRIFGKNGTQNTPFPTVKIGDTSLQCLFSPDDGVEAAILKAVDGAKERIDFAAFSFTSVPIAEHIAKRIKAGVKVRGMFEKGGAGGKYSRDDFLIENGAQVKLDTNPKNMHNKFMVVDARTVITGSYNFSKNAEENNDENCLILHDPKIAALYLENFETMLSVR